MFSILQNRQINNIWMYLCISENTIWTESWTKSPCLLLIPIFHLVVIETFGRCQLHPELCPHPKDGQDYAHNGHKERQLDLVTEHSTKQFQYQVIVGVNSVSKVCHTELKSYSKIFYFYQHPVLTCIPARYGVDTVKMTSLTDSL